MKIRYLITNEDKPVFLYRLCEGRTQADAFYGRNWFEDAHTCVELESRDFNRIIPRREAKSLFPEAFK